MEVILIPEVSDSDNSEISRHDAPVRSHVFPLISGI